MKNTISDYIVKNALTHIDATGIHIHAKAEDQNEMPCIRGRSIQLSPGASWDYGYLVYSLPNKVTIYLK